VFKLLEGKCLQQTPLDGDDDDGNGGDDAGDQWKRVLNNSIPMYTVMKEVFIEFVDSFAKLM
jgi:hypothetical protein